MTTSTLLRVGSTGPLVSAVQWFLNDTAVEDELATDGIYGNLTRNAVAEFQSRTQLSPDGIVGPNTWGTIGDHLEADANSAPAGRTAPSYPDATSPELAMSFIERGGGFGNTHRFGGNGSHGTGGGNGSYGAGGGGGTKTGKTKSGGNVKQYKSHVNPHGISRISKNRWILGVIYFETDSYRLDKEDRKELQKLEAFKRFWDKHPSTPSVLFRYDAWCDTTGTFEYNKKLAKQRGEAVEKHVRHMVLHDHAKYQTPAAVNPIGRKWKPKPTPNAAERVVIIIGPPLKRKKPSTPAKPTLTRRLIRAKVALMKHPPSQVQFHHILCWLAKLWAEDQGGSKHKCKDLFWDGENAAFKKAMNAIRPPLSSAEAKSMQMVVRDLLMGPGFSSKKSLKHSRDVLVGIDLKIIESMRVVKRNMALTGGSGSQKGCKALLQVNTHLFAPPTKHHHGGLINDPRSVYHCYRDVLKP